MAANHNFEHLPLPLVLHGKPKLNGGSPTSTTTTENRNNRTGHGGYIKRRTADLSRFWKERQQSRIAENLPQLETGIPILLEIDPFADIDFLRGLGFEIVSELENGFIIVASDDVDLQILNQKTEDFINNISVRCNSPAKIYGLREDYDRLGMILSPGLYSKWNSILDDKEYFVDIGVSCSGNIELPKQPQRNSEESDEHYENRLNRWRLKSTEAYMLWDGLKSEREGIIETLIIAYNGEIIDFVDGTSTLTDLPDSFSARLRINGKCLRDLVLNIPFIFEVIESDEIRISTSSEQIQQVNPNVEIVAPLDNYPKICVVDSGIQEGHQYIAPAIISDESICLIPSKNNTYDEVDDGGHGTRVAGAILYPQNIPVSGIYELPCWIRNIRVLDEDNYLPLELYPPKLISNIVSCFRNGLSEATKIFNHSIGSNSPCELKHMSAWAAEVDYQSYQNDVLFIQSAGNIKSDIIVAYIQAGYLYPEYLSRELSRVCDPSQSLQALTVGSISNNNYETEDAIALGQKDEPSAFSRSGPGIWDVIKPEVVEYGGTDVINKSGGPPTLTTPPEVCPELIRKSPEGPAFARDSVGTSYSTPKVTYIAAEIQKLFPDSSTLLYRALIAQSARWPEWTARIPKGNYVNVLRSIGYGVPDVSRATHNTEYRITLVTDSLLEIGEGEAHIFRIPIPDELSSVGEDYEILVEITLSYAANPRRTRRSVKRYLSTWVDWCCSRIGEEAEAFAQRIFETGASVEDDGNFDWMIGEASNRGIINNFSRKNGTLQKDWCLINSNQLSDAFCIAVRGHKGWSNLFKAKYSLAVSLEAINQDIPIYESIRTMVEVEIQNNEIEVELE